MFSSLSQLLKRSGKKGVDRHDYLKELVEEYKTSKNKDTQEQVIANLANFSYDPLNYRWLIDLGVIDIFLQEILQSTGLLQQFSITGLCNLAAEDSARTLILIKDGASIVASLLSSVNEKCIIDAIATLIFLTADKNKTEIVDEKSLDQIREHSRNENPRIRNLAQIFLTHIHYSFPINQ